MIRRFVRLVDTRSVSVFRETSKRFFGLSKSTWIVFKCVNLCKCIFNGGSFPGNMCGQPKLHVFKMNVSYSHFVDANDSYFANIVSLCWFYLCVSCIVTWIKVGPPSIRQSSFTVHEFDICPFSSMKPKRYKLLRKSHQQCFGSVGRH